MNYDDVYLKIKRENQILFTRDSECLQDLLSLIRKQKHRTIVMWVLDLANETVNILSQRYPNEMRPLNALNACKEWAQGKTKMHEAKRELQNTCEKPTL